MPLPLPNPTRPYPTHTNAKGTVHVGRVEECFACPQPELDPEECNDTRKLAFEHAVALLHDGYTLTAPAAHSLPEATYRIGAGGVCFIDGTEIDADTFAATLTADCADAQ